jgi:toxin FitB
VPARVFRFCTRRLRGLDQLIWALVFVWVTGLRPIARIITIAVAETGVWRNCSARRWRTSAGDRLRGLSRSARGSSGGCALGPADRLFTTVSQARILVGLAIMPEGRRCAGGLEAAAHAMFQEDFDGRVLPFDDRLAAACATIFAVRSRNVGDFEECGVVIIDPWSIWPLRPVAVTPP